jgi:hypothetical protein
MRPIRSTRLAALLVALALLAVPPAALADGDPASDILLIQDTFLPYQPKVSPNVAAAVKQAAARAKAAGFPLKVAVIGSATDLGAVPDLFGKPQKYADFLDQEISFNKKMLLLVVMPQGFGISAAGPPSALAGLRVPGAGGVDALARAALPAIGALAAHAGHPIVLPVVGSSGGSGGSGGTSPVLTFGAPLAVVLLVAAGAGFARARRGRTDDDRAVGDQYDEDDEDDDEHEDDADADEDDADADEDDADADEDDDEGPDAPPAAPPTAPEGSPESPPESPGTRS